MIYTVTLNPSMDHYVSISKLDIGHINRAEENWSVPGGKSVNVSKVVKNLGLETEALIFTGGEVGKAINNILSKELSVKSFDVDGDSRINVKVLDSKEFKVTEINGDGPIVTKEHINELTKYLKEVVTKDDYIVLSGSVPKGTTNEAYKMIMREVRGTGAKFVVDTIAPSLLATLGYRPFLIKPNINELRDIFRDDFYTKEEMLIYGNKLRSYGAANCIVSQGDKGAYFLGDHVIYYAKALKGKVINTIGSGDSMVAGFIAGYEKYKNNKDAFRYAVAVASATCFSKDLASKEDTDRLLEEVEIEEIKVSN